jgi:hypothetical protein
MENLKPKDPKNEESSILTNTTVAQEPVVFHIDGVLDLHTFSPKEVADLLGDYVDE